MYPDNERGGDVSNEKNLIPFNERTESEQREIAQKGGIASGAARRRKRSMRQAADYYLSLPETDRRPGKRPCCGTRLTRRTWTTR